MSIDTNALIAQMNAITEMENEAKRKRAEIASQREQLINALTDMVNAHLGEANVCLLQLNQLGMSYSMLTLGPSNPKAKDTKGTTRSQGHCELCKMDGHDARSHRNQPEKRAFTLAELITRQLPTDGYVEPATVAAAA